MLKVLLLLLSANFVFAGLTHSERVVALTILGEARGEGKAGMYAVACVIKQRAVERKKSLAAVCLQRKQFSCWNSGRDLSHLFKSPAADYAIRLAKGMVSGKDLDRRYVNFANHYCTLNTRPYWSKGIKPVKTIKNHKFYKIK